MLEHSVFVSTYTNISSEVGQGAAALTFDMCTYTNINPFFSQGAGALTFDMSTYASTD
jgi:hypothetical protein